MRSSREAEIAQGLREPGGALIGGLHVLDYNQGHTDFEEGTPPPPVSSTSYDLGRARAAEKAEFEADVMARLEAQQERSHQAVRDLLKDRPDLLADYDAKIAEISAAAKP
jgi:hypothetical protein